jgi:hypothetical protein
MILETSLDMPGCCSGLTLKALSAVVFLVCRLHVECSSNLSTADLEAEVFLHVLHNCVEYVQAEGDPDPRSAASVAYADGDGMTRCVVLLSNPGQQLMARRIKRLAAF